MAIEKKSLIKSRAATKKAIIATNTTPVEVKPLTAKPLTAKPLTAKP
ncbi:MAG TPA: hypothetical protein VES66_01585 [Terriglobales bacterium]|nr:hypothetical protein [Terriglobales bacterium]